MYNFALKQVSSSQRWLAAADINGLKAKFMEDNY